MPNPTETTPNPTAPTAKIIDNAKECYRMSKAWAFVEAAMFNHGDYRTPEGRLEIKDTCFNEVVAPAIRAGVSKETVERIRSSVRSR